jgi:predicted ATPase with chaperone activity
VNITKKVVQRPVAPRTIEEAGVDFDLMLQLSVKMLNSSGELSGVELGSRLGVMWSVIEPCLDLLKRERQCEIAGGTLLGPASYRYRLTDAGRARATLFLEGSHYVGRVPVPIDQYVSYMTNAVKRNEAIEITPDSVRRAFSNLVLSPSVLDHLGPAIAARHSLFVYGPSGNGKTVISQAIRNLLVEDIAIPHALVVGGQIIQVFDPANHEQVERSPESALAVDRDTVEDERWTLCRRPLVTVGGELTLDQLELSHNPATGFCRAPVQVVANGGVLVIDDFGRQQASPRDVLNRWIVPLESRVDYLTLQTGQKFGLPFDVLVVFATNLDPADLVDDAFLRRIQYKVRAEGPTIEQFIQIFANYCKKRELAFDRGLITRLIETELRPRGVVLQGCHPRDLIEHALVFARYHSRPRELTLDLLVEACRSYFVESPRLERLTQAA